MRSKLYNLVFEVNILVKKLYLIRIQSKDKHIIRVYLYFSMDMVSNNRVNKI